MLQCTMGEPILDSISVDFSLGLLEKDAALWAGDNGPWMSRIGLPSREVHYFPPIMNSSRCWPGCGTLGAEMSCWVCGSCCPCRTGISGSLITSGKSCISLAAGRSVDSPVMFALEKALSQESVLQKFRMEQADFDLPVTWVMLSSHSSFTIPLASLDPCFSHSFILKKPKKF